MRLSKPLIFDIKITEQRIQSLAYAKKMGNSIMNITPTQLRKSAKHIGHMRFFGRAEPQECGSVSLFQPPELQ